MRLDKLLWFLRLARTRPLAQAMCEAGQIRLNGRRVERAHARVGVGDTLVVPLATGQVLPIEIAALPLRRGPASEARACYRALDERPAFPIAADKPIAWPEGDTPP